MARAYGTAAGGHARTGDSARTVVSYLRRSLYLAREDV